MSLEEIFTKQNLYKSAIDCTKGKKWKATTSTFMRNLISNVSRVQKELLNETYKPKMGKEFTILERGKLRKINPPKYEERVVEKCLCDNYLVPLLSKSLIYDCGASLKNKGIHFSKRRIGTHLTQYFKKFGNKGYVLTLDIHDYFNSINHDVLINFLDRKIEDKRVLLLIKNIIKTHGEKGLGLGSQVSQISALFYLSHLDHDIKEKFNFKFYGRYMDDFYILSNDKEKLELAFEYIKQQFQDIYFLSLNEKKSKIKHLKNGFQFLKVKYLLLENGKILRLLTTKCFANIKRKLKKIINKEKMFPIIASFMSYIKSFNANKKLIRFNKLIYRFI